MRKGKKIKSKAHGNKSTTWEPKLRAIIFTGLKKKTGLLNLAERYLRPVNLIDLEHSTRQ